MLFRAVLAAASLATAGFAQTIDDEVALLPSCGMTCLTAAAVAAGCDSDDYSCICGSGRQIVRSHAIPCIATSCSSSDALKIQPIATQICVLEAAQNVSSSAPSSTTAQASTSASTSATLTSSLLSQVTGSRSSSTTSLASATFTINTNLSSSSSSASPLASKQGLSKGAITGVAVGASLGALFLLAVTGFLVFGCRKRSRDMMHLAGLSASEMTLGRHDLSGPNA